MIPIEGVQFKRNIRKFLSGQDIGARVKAEGGANKNLACGDREKAVPGEVLPRGQERGVDAAGGGRCHHEFVPSPRSYSTQGEL